MNALRDKLSYAELTQDCLEKRTGEPAWLYQIREKAFARFKALGFPDRKSESWKYIYLDGILQTRWETALPDAVPHKNTSRLPSELIEEKNVLVFHNGHYDASKSRLSKPLQSLFSFKLDDQSAWAQESFAADASSEKNVFISLNTVLCRDGVFLRLPKGTVVESPLHIVFSNDGLLPISYPRILIEAQAGSQLETVIYLNAATANRSWVNGVAEFHVGRDARVSAQVIQQNGTDAVQFFQIKAKVAEAGNFEALYYTSGGAVVRNQTEMDLQGIKSFASASGLSLLSGNSQAFHHLTVNHQVPDCTSRQVFKNVLAGKSLAEFDSTVHVWRGAKHSDSEQLDKNLILSDSARVYARPQLKIDHDDVKASHGAATGPLQPGEIFYLQSRGLSPEQARFLLIYGFAEQVLEKVRISWLRKALESEMESKVKEILKTEGHLL